MKLTKGHLKKLVPFVTALAIIFSAMAQTNSVALASGGSSDDAFSGSTPEVYHSEQHRKIVSDKGEVAIIDTEVTTIAPGDSSELSHLEPVALDAIETAKREGGKEPLLFVEHDGKTEEVSKASFMASLRKLAQSGINDVKGDPIWLPTLSISRGAVNGIVIGALLLQQGFPHNAAFVGGFTAFVESFICMMYSTATTEWFNKDKRYSIQFRKGMEMSGVYLAILRLAMLATGHPLDPTLWGSIVHNTSDAFVGTVTQEPANILIGQISEERVSAGGNRKYIYKVRNMSYFGVSAFVALITAMHLSPNPHVRTMVQLLNATVAVPSTIYLGYKQNWFKSLRAGWERVAVTVSLGPFAVAEEFYIMALRALGKIKKPGEIPDSVSSAAEEQLEDSKRAVCDGGMNLI